jgi:hypothetical protein
MIQIVEEYERYVLNIPDLINKSNHFFDCEFIEDVVYYFFISLFGVNCPDYFHIDFGIDLNWHIFFCSRKSRIRKNNHFFILPFVFVICSP